VHVCNSCCYTPRHLLQSATMLPYRLQRNEHANGVLQDTSLVFEDRTGAGTYKTGSFNLGFSYSSILVLYDSSHLTCACFYRRFITSERRGQVVSTHASHSTGAGFRSRAGQLSSLMKLSLIFPFLLRKFRDSTCNEVTTAPFHIRYNPLFIILSFGLLCY
jgi:hypothetical protein